jgi:hypothetical protein
MGVKSPARFFTKYLQTSGHNLVYNINSDTSFVVPKRYSAALRKIERCEHGTESIHISR